MTEMDQRIGRNIRQIMDAKGIKHVFLGKALGKSSVEMSRILAGDRALRAHDLPIVAKTIGCTLDDLFAADNPA